MNNQVSLNTAILSFAFSGVLAPHRSGNQMPKPAPSVTPKKK
jgi:hypothetical protein